MKEEWILTEIGHYEKRKKTKMLCAAPVSNRMSNVIDLPVPVLGQPLLVTGNGHELLIANRKER